MTEQEKRKEWDKKAAIIAHSIAEQITAIENITNYGALRIVDHVKYIIESSMENQPPKIKTEIRDKWGNIIEMPEAEAPGEKKETNP